MSYYRQYTGSLYPFVAVSVRLKAYYCRKSGKCCNTQSITLKKYRTELSHYPVRQQINCAGSGVPIAGNSLETF